MLNIITSCYDVSDLEKLKKVNVTSVIIGNERFSVHYAKSIAFNDYLKIKQECERLNLNLYVLVNRLFEEKDLVELEEHLLFLKELDVDGIYFSDLAVYMLAQKLGIVDRLIYNPDTTLSCYQDINEFMSLGIKMATISKEITLEEVYQICDNALGNLEMIVFGYLNMSISKRMLLDNYLTHIGKNINVKNNRNLFLTEETRSEMMPIFEDDYGTYIYSGYILTSFNEIKDIVKRVKNIRIDGIFKDIDYLVDIIAMYQKVLNDEISGEDALAYVKNKYENDNYTTGYFYQKTNLERSK